MLRAMSCRASVVVGLGLLGLASGCAYGEVRQVVRAQFASELDCPEVQIKRGYDTPNQFKVFGCGVVRTYTCNDADGRVSYDEPACTWVNGDADAPQMAKPSPEPGDEPLDEPPAAEEAPLEDSSSSESEDSLDDDSTDTDVEEAEPEAETESEPASKPPVKKGGAKVGGSLKLGR
jgi:hypothetical protein